MGVNASSGNWGANTGVWNDGPWIVQLTVYNTVDGKRTAAGFETIEVSTYSEADALVRQRDPVTGHIRGGGIRRKLPSAA